MERIRGLRAVLMFVKHMISFVVYAFSLMIPRDKKKWIYGNYNGSFRDNAKYFYLYCSTNHPEIEHIWISKNKEVVDKINGLGYKACYKYTVRAFLHAITAKVYIYNIYATPDIYNGSFRGTAFLFNMWHGVPYKKIEYDIVTGPLQVYYNPKTFDEKMQSFLMEPKTFRKSSAVLTTSERLVPIYSSAFQLTSKRICVAPYPRNTIFNTRKEDLLNHIRKIETPEVADFIKTFDSYNKVIVYMPTWRDAKKDFMGDAIPSFDELNNVCSKSNCLFLIKSHVLTKFSVDLTKFSHIKNLDSTIDMYPLLPFTDALVSDYSSIIFDYSLLKKKIFFYAYDKEEYLSKNREAYFEYEGVFSNQVTGSFEQLLQEIDEFGQEEKSKSYSYPNTEALLENNASMEDIYKFISSSISLN